MRRLVCGGRKFADREKLFSVLGDLRKEGEFEIGCGYDPKGERFQGADQLAYEWAKSRGVSGRCYPAHWRVFGNSAGPRRNTRMLEQFAPDEVWAWPGGAGTANMVDQARRAGVPVVTVGSDGRTSRGRARAATGGLTKVFSDIAGPQRDYPPSPTGFGRPRSRR